MLAVEELLFELGEDHDSMKEQATGLPPGFRFHPTDEELITFYLASKVFSGTFSGVEIAELDLNRCEPWDLPDVAKMGEREWYFFSLRDRKYPTGVRTNRATGAGYWKATGKDREVYSTTTAAANGGGGVGGLLGMKKTLVFYKGRAPRGEKTKWVMHEYRLDGHFSIRHTSKEEWVICRIFHKSAEKKNGVLQFGGGQNLGYYSSLPLLLESPATATTFLLESESNKEMIPSMETNMIQNPFLYEENDLKTLLNAIQPSFSATAAAAAATTTTARNKNQNNVIMGTNTNMNQSPGSNSMLFKSFLPFQEQSTIPKQCKTEQPNFSHFQLPPVTDTDNFNINWMDKIHHPCPCPCPCPSSTTTTTTNTCQNPLFFEMDCNILGVSETTAPAAPAPATADTTTTTTSAHDMSTSSTAFNFNRPSFHMTLDPSIPHLLGQSWPLDHPII